MSYDLTFIKYHKKPHVTAEQIYQTLTSGGHLPGLEEIPVADIRRDITNCFTGWNTTEGTVTDFERGNSSFQILFDPYFIRVDCYGDSSVYKERLQGILSGKHGLHMYDPQWDVLFEVLGGKKAQKSAAEAEEILKGRIAEKGFTFMGSNPLLFKRDNPLELSRDVRCVRENTEVRQSCILHVYGQKHADAVNFGLHFLLKYRKLDEMVSAIRGTPLNTYTDDFPTVHFSITEASNGAVRPTYYAFKNGTDPAAFAERILDDLEEYAFPVFDHTDSLQKYEDALLDGKSRAIRPAVAFREYYQIALALLNRGDIDEKLLERLLKKAEKNDEAYDPGCIGRIRAYISH